MKQLNKICISITLFFVMFVSAQNFQGVATYETKRNVDLKMDSTQVGNEQQEAIKVMLRKQFEKTYTLTFTKTESIYKEIKKLDVPKAQQSGMIIKIGGADNILYKNIKNQTFVDAQEMFGKKFLIKDDIKKLVWKTEKETKMIGKYLCLKATLVDMIDDYDMSGNKKEKQKEQYITAWYTPEIPIANGPSDFDGLPGLILELHQGKMHYVCSKIVMNPKEKIEIIAPKKGKIVSQKEFDKIMDKKEKEMRANFDDGRKKGNKHGTTIWIGG